jgi:hypothetical protein
MRTKAMILSDIARFTKSVNETQERIEQTMTLPRGAFRDELLESLDYDLDRDHSRLSHWQEQLELFEGTNVKNISTRLMNRSSEQAQIKHALTNLIETYGKDAVILANKSLKLTRKAIAKKAA